MHIFKKGGGHLACLRPEVGSRTCKKYMSQVACYPLIAGQGGGFFVCADQI